MAFEDGKPIDAAELSKLATAINMLDAKIPKIGSGTSTSSSSSSSLDNTLVSTPKAIIGDITERTGTLSPSTMHTMRVNFPSSAYGTPKSVTVTPVHGYNAAGKYDFNPYVYNVSSSGFDIGLWVGSQATSGASTRFYWMAIFG